MRTFSTIPCVLFVLSVFLVLTRAEETAMPDFTAVSDEARVIVVKPGATLGDLNGTVYVDGKYRTPKIGSTLLSLPLESGEHFLVSESPGDTGVLIDLKSGTLYYLIDPSDASALVSLGDILYGKKNHAGALTVYRMALKTDPAVTGFYKRYAELAIEAKAKDEEIIRALSGVVNSNGADITTFLTLARIYKKNADYVKTPAPQKKADYGKSVEMYEKVIGFDAQNREALQAIAECKSKLGDTQGAAGALEDVVEANPEAVNEYKKLGDLYSKQNQKAEAMNAYRTYLDKGGNDQSVARKLGGYYYQLKQYKDAAKYLAQVKGKEGLEISHQLILADAYFNAGDFNNAIIVYKALNAKTLKLETKKNVLKKLVETYVQLNDNAKALYWFTQYSKLSKGKNAEMAYLNAFLQEKASPIKAQQLYESNTKLYPKDHRNYLRLGMMYSKKRETLSKAIPLLKKAVTLADTIPQTWFEIADAYGKLGNTNEELDAYKKYIQTDPENLDANIRVGSILLERNKIPEGMVYLEKANIKAPDNVNVMIGLAKGYAVTGRSDEAMELLTRAKKLRPEELEIRRQLFSIYQEKGLQQQALDEIKQLLAINRDSETLLLYAQLLIKSNDLTGAENAIEDIRAIDPENIEALMLLASILEGNKKYDDAIQIYKEIAQIDPQYNLAINGQAKVYLALGKILWAEKYFKSALLNDPDLAQAELGLAKIASMRKDIAAYKKHLDRAYLLDPKDPEIKEEYQKANKK